MVVDRSLFPLDQRYPDRLQIRLIPVEKFYPLYSLGSRCKLNTALSWLSKGDREATAATYLWNVA